MPTELQDEQMTIYGHLMFEVKLRAKSTEYAINGHTGLDGWLVREFCFLQLRMMCELTALACLLAHGDIDATKASKFQSSGAADDILKGLENLSPGAFPRALGEPVLVDDVRRFTEREPDYMTKEELLKLYGRTCGDALHRGSLKNLRKPRMPIQKHFPEISVPVQRLLNLLSAHRIELMDGEVQLMCFLGKPEDKVHVSLAEAVEPASHA